MSPRPVRSTPVRHRLATLLVALTLAITGLSACGSGPVQTNAEGTYVIGQTAPIDYLTPHGFNQSTMTWVRALYDALVVMDPEPTPHLATAWETSEDQLTYTFELADGVTFHDGTPLTAQIVVDNLVWATDPANLVTGAAVLGTGEYKALDEHTVRMSFPAPVPQLLSTLAIVPIMDLSRDLATEPNGTGPYQLTRFVPNSVVEMSRNGAYWNTERQPQVANLAVRVYTDNAALLSALTSGQIQVVAFPPFNQQRRIRQEEIDLIQQGPPGNFILRLNLKTPALQDVRVRQALSLALDRETFVNLTAAEGVTATRNIYPAASVAYLPDLDADQGQDLEGAKALLAEAGYADGLDVEMDVLSTRQPELAAFAPIFQEDLKEIGVNLTLNEITATLNTTRLLGGTYQISTDWYPWGNLDPALLFVTRTFTPDATFEYYEDATYTQLVADAQAEVDPQRRTERYQELNQYMVDAAFVIPVASRPYTYAVRPEVSGFEFDPFGMADPSTASFTPQTQN